MRSRRFVVFLSVAMSVCSIGVVTTMQMATPPPVFTSPEVLPDRHVVFRIFAPRAE